MGATSAGDANITPHQQQQPRVLPSPSMMEVSGDGTGGGGGGGGGARRKQRNAQQDRKTLNLSLFMVFGALLPFFFSQARSVARVKAIYLHLSADSGASYPVQSIIHLSIIIYITQRI